jgi:hypothetical protein
VWIALAPLGPVPFVEVYKGWIPERFAVVAGRSFCFAHIDVDLYRPTLDSMAFFYPRMAPGGIILLDDYGFSTCPGVTEAVDRLHGGQAGVGHQSRFRQRIHFESEGMSEAMTIDSAARRLRGRIQFTNADRLFFIQLYRWFPSILKAVTIVRPETLVRWHRAGFRRYSRNLRLPANQCRLAGIDPADER